MNQVFLSGVAQGDARLLSRAGETAHAVMTLTVTHRTAAGVARQEQYAVSAWRGTAQRMAERVRGGNRVTVRGYLSQRRTAWGLQTEVTATEFQATAGAGPADSGQAFLRAPEPVQAAGAEEA